MYIKYLSLSFSVFSLISLPLQVNTQFPVLCTIKILRILVSNSSFNLATQLASLPLTTNALVQVLLVSLLPAMMGGAGTRNSIWLEWALTLSEVLPLPDSVNSTLSWFSPFSLTTPPQFPLKVTCPVPDF